MTDGFVFVISPYVTGAAAVPACLIRYALSARKGSGGIPPTADDGRAVVRSIWRWAIGLVAFGHLAALGFPGWVLRWNQQPIRLFVLEAAGATAGAVAFLALVAMSVRRSRRSPASPSPWSVVAWTLLLLDLVSGIALAIAFRWASSWSAVTVAPYVHSLVQFAPATALVGRLPLLARMHIFGGFVAVAVAPFAASPHLIVRPIGFMLRWARSSVGNRLAAGRSVLDAASMQLQPLRARVTRSDGEEN